MTEKLQQRCGACLKSEGLHCADIGSPSYRFVYKAYWKDLRQPFIASGRIETCARFQNFMHLMEIKGRKRLKRNIVNSA